jgi:hypothetical protein
MIETTRRYRRGLRTSHGPLCWFTDPETGATVEGFLTGKQRVTKTVQLTEHGLVELTYHVPADVPIKLGWRA